jgi:hypothetical protein
MDNQTNYREQPELRCCNNCKHIDFDHSGHECPILRLQTGRRWVDPAAVCDLFEKEVNESPDWTSLVS